MRALFDIAVQSRHPPRTLPLVCMSLEELIQACAESGNAEAWEEFVQRFHSLIAVVVLRTAQRWGNTSSILVDDLIQDTYLRICSDRKRLLGEFTPHHPEAFLGYLKVITANVVHDHFRAQHSHKRGSGQTEASIDDPGTPAPVATDNIGDIDRHILLKEVDAALRSSLSDEDQTRDYTIFWLYYRYGLTASAIARLPSISLTVKGVESVIHRLTRVVRERLSERDKV
jgi:RNA polymerase sigma-70 factor (ECF subfamily)